MAKEIKYSFEQWCIDNKRNDILDRWDYDKNEVPPSKVSYVTTKYYYLKCPSGLHSSELQPIARISVRGGKSLLCHECNPTGTTFNKRASNFKDITGQKFGELTVIKLDEERNNQHKNNQTYWICECSCGKKCSTYYSALKNGAQKTCGDRSFHVLGENNPNWKGGITPELLSERTSKRYNEWRDAVYAKDWYTCQCCGAYGQRIDKNAHHIDNFSEFEEKRYDLSNSILLCSECHHIKYPNSFHSIYGTRNNNGEQLEEYINSRRKELGIPIPFSLDAYLNGNILTPGDVEWAKEYYANIKVRPDRGFKKILPKFRVTQE